MKHDISTGEVTFKEIAARYRVSIGTVSAIGTGRNWGWLKVDGFKEGLRRVNARGDRRGIAD
jgi:hypothetical protein